MKLTVDQKRILVEIEREGRAFFSRDTTEDYRRAAEAWLNRMASRAARRSEGDER